MITFIETTLFSRRVSEYLGDDEYSALQWELASDPEAGDLIRGSGGIRKLRWAGSGRGKRGGLRVIYYWRTRAGQILLLTLYAKNEMADLTRAEVAALRKIVEGIGDD